MEQERNVDRLAGILIKVGIFAVIALMCWYFRSVLVYVIGAFVVSLIGHPLVRLLRKIKIRGKSLPDALLTVVAIIIILATILLLIAQFIPVVTGIIHDTSLMNAQDLPYNSLLDQLDIWLISIFPSLGSDFNLVNFLLDQFKGVLSFSSVSSMLGSVTTLASSLGVGLFSVFFISFFFIKDELLFGKIICALVPDRIEASVFSTIEDITHLLSRYFVGIIIEVLAVAIIDFLGLWLIARIGVGYALGIAFMAGLLNIIPYVGPLVGEVMGVLLCLVLKYGAGVGLDMPVLAFMIIVLAIMLFAQFIDNMVLQPVIYSTSIMASPLEIFIVLLMAGHIGGTVGLIVGVPAYTVVRVIAARFFAENKIVKRLMPGIEQENTDALL